MEPSAIKLGGGMVVKLNALLDRPESQSHAVGLLLNAADLIAGFDEDLSADIRAKATAIDGAENAQYWQDIATPTKEIEV